MDPLSAIASVCNEFEIIIPEDKCPKSIFVYYMKNGTIITVHLHESQLFDLLDRLEPYTFWIASYSFDHLMDKLQNYCYLELILINTTGNHKKYISSRDIFEDLQNDTKIFDHVDEETLSIDDTKILWRTAICYFVDSEFLNQLTGSNFGQLCEGFISGFYIAAIWIYHQVRKSKIQKIKSARK